MVSFLLDNSLGAWWAARRLTEQDLAATTSEEELRSKAAIAGASLEYLRFVKQEDDGGNECWTPAAGTFDAWPKNLSELKTLDPCCGSGHFLVAAFLMLVPMRMDADGLSARDAVDAVLSENINGLELDQRCVELAAFALALAAWKYPGSGGYRALPELNMACSGLSVSAKKDEWMDLAGENANLRLALEELYKQFKDAPLLGSLINPGASLGKGSLFELEWEEVGPLLTKALAGEKDQERSEIGVVALGVSKSASLLSEKYHWVISNVPYHSSNNLNDDIRSFSVEKYSDGATDLATVFLLRIFDYLLLEGNCSLVMPQNWLVQPSYRSLRKRLLSRHGIRVAARLGPGAFQEISGEVVNALLLSIDLGIRPSFIALDCGRDTPYENKAEFLKLNTTAKKLTGEQLGNPDSVIFLGDQVGPRAFLGDSASSVQGIKTGEADRYKRKFWEVPLMSVDWIFYQSTARSTSEFGGLEHILYWGESGEHLARKQGMSAWGKNGVAVSQMSSLPCCAYLGGAFDSNMTAIAVNQSTELLALHGFAMDGAFSKAVREFDQSLKPTNSSFEKVLFDKETWVSYSNINYPKGLPRPFSDDHTQWVFHGHPCGSVVWDEAIKWTIHGPLRCDDSVLQVAVARLLGYRWPAERDASMELADDQRELVNRCEMLLTFVDDDGIACIPAVRGEQPVYQRVETLLQAAYGEQWSISVRDKLLESVGCKNKSLDFWLREKFFEQHCKLFQHRPFIWHIWDGLKDGFAALVNYHQLDRKNLERLVYTYLDDWIRTQKQGQSDGVDGAGVRLAAAQGLKRRLEQILEGESPYDIFVRWKPLERQPVSWDPDLNDGVRLNIRPFLSVEDVGKKGTGILRAKPNIHWKKDRGKDVPSAPWYGLGLDYDEGEGARINDHHLTLAAKKAVTDD